MADISHILGGAWTPPAPKPIKSTEDQLRDAMLDRGITPPTDISIDGKLHRFRSGTKGEGGHDKSGWYVIYGDGIPSGQFGDWRTGEAINFRADIGRELSMAEQLTNTRRQAEAKAMREAELKLTRQAAENTVNTIWESAHAASAEHPYLKRKGIQTHGARITGDGRLIVPLYDQDGTLSSLQYIAHDSQKLYHSGGQTGGKFWVVGTLDEPGILYVAEGFATAATIHEVTGRPCVVAYSASNIVPVVGAWREKLGVTQEIVIVADHDSHGVGQKYADQASAKYGARVVMPPIEGMDANDYAMAGNDLKALLNPPATDWLIHADDFCAQPAPISWLVKNWIQAQALVMVHGPSGGGKTFAVLDWCLRIASGGGLWMDTHKVKAGGIVYLAGEGHHGLRGRVAAWKQAHSVTKLNMWLSKDGCDLNTADGYLRVVSNIRALPNVPEVIVVDTLHRFLLGDENSSQDAKTMLDACAGLMREFNCTVILVHHTGVSDEAQHRARGSSAWRGALDIEISIVPSKDDNPMEIVQRKSKDAEMAETVYANLETVEIAGWFDEDGQQVTSAVLSKSDAPVAATTKKDSKLDSHRKMFENAWWNAGADVFNNMPYITRSAFNTYLVRNLELSEASAKLYMKPSATGRVIADLINSEIIAIMQDGWAVIDQVQASSMLIRKAG
jgi:putative DNA primase/helicase